MRGLEDKRVLVTGGAQGIGAATAARFLEEEARVVVLDKSAAALADIRRILPKLEAVLMADVSDAEAVRDAFIRLDGLWGGLDVLVNNAGISVRHRFVDIHPEEWRRVLATNLDGVFHCAREAARRMTEAESGGVILNMGSTNGLAGYHYYADYNASKAGVIELTRSMALELAPRIRVNCVCPGDVETPMLPDEAEKRGISWEDYHAAAADRPLGRVGTPDEIARAVLFLASDDSSFITGAALVVDGGGVAG